MSSALNRIEEKLKQSKLNCNYYEAHQLYTSLYYRYKAKKREAVARDMLVEGAIYLFENKQYSSGSSLSMMYIESLENSVTEKTDEIISTLAKLHSLMPQEVPELEAFDKRAVMWTASCRDVPNTGDKQLRTQFAHTYWKNKMYLEARQNFLYSNDGVSFGKMLQELAVQHGLPGETDLFLTQAVLQLLCLQSLQNANEVFLSYTQHHPQVGKGPPFKYPLINFLCFLLVAVEQKKVTVFTILCEQYHVSLRRDVLYFNYLDKIAQHYFGAPPPKRRRTGFLDNLMQSLLDDDEEDHFESCDDFEPLHSEKTMTEEDLD